MTMDGSSPCSFTAHTWAIKAELSEMYSCAHVVEVITFTETWPLDFENQEDATATSVQYKCRRAPLEFKCVNCWTWGNATT